MSAIAAPIDTYSFDFNAMRFTLTLKPCTNKTILEMSKGAKGPSGQTLTWYAGKVVYVSLNATYDMCFTVNPENPLQLYVIDSDGDGGMVQRPVPKPAGV